MAEGVATYILLSFFVTPARRKIVKGAGKIVATKIRSIYQDRFPTLTAESDNLTRATLKFHLTENCMEVKLPKYIHTQM